MKLRTKIMLSLLTGLLAMLFYSMPFWWGVLFTPLTESLTTAPAADSVSGPCLELSDGTVLRFKTLDALYTFFHQS